MKEQPKEDTQQLISINGADIDDKFDLISLI